MRQVYTIEGQAALQFVPGADPPSNCECVGLSPAENVSVRENTGVIVAGGDLFDLLVLEGVVDLGGVNAGGLEY